MFIPTIVDKEGNISYLSQNWVFSLTKKQAKEIYEKEFDLIEGRDYNDLKIFCDITKIFDNITDVDFDSSGETIYEILLD